MLDGIGQNGVRDTGDTRPMLDAGWNRANSGVNHRDTRDTRPMLDGVRDTSTRSTHLTPHET